jgi:glycosyltransferase involved in cell wall biosynthesis
VKLAVVTSGFPRRSETFALNELLELERRGLLAAVLATKPGDGAPPHPGVQTLLPKLALVSDPDEAARVASDAGATAFHGYFAHRPAEVAALAAAELDVPHGFSAHARDVRKVDDLGARAAAAACVIACNDDVAADLRGAGARPTLVPHGVDLDRFRPSPAPARRELALLAVGRLVPKKGFDVLVAAAARLTFPFRLRIVGDGPERERLVGLDERVELAGPVTHDELPALYAAADVVVVPSVEDADGDRDGLPNVVLEAMASCRPVVASDVGAIASAGAGLLVPPGDPGALAAALTDLARRPARRRRLGEHARQQAEARFGLVACTDRLCRVLEEAYA